MAKYSVIGYYKEDNQTSADEVVADSGEEALAMVARERLGERDAAGDYEHQGEFELVVAVLKFTTLDNLLTFPGDGLVEAREYIEPGWELEEMEGQANGEA